MPLPLLLLTRPEAQARALAAALDTPCEVVIAPLTEVVALDWDRGLAQGIRGLILTSANAVPFVAGLAPLPAWCVGEATARAAAQAGFAARASGGDAAALIADLARERPQGPLLHAHGRHLARDLRPALEPLGIALRAAAVYEARALPWPQGLAQRLEGRRVVAPVYSPRAAAELSARLPAPPPGLSVVAISENARARLSPELAAQARVVARPEAMRAAILSQLSAPP